MLKAPSADTNIPAVKVDPSRILSPRSMFSTLKEIKNEIDIEITREFSNTCAMLVEVFKDMPTQIQPRLLELREQERKLIRECETLFNRHMGELIHLEVGNTLVSIFGPVGELIQRQHGEFLELMSMLEKELQAYFTMAADQVLITAPMKIAEFEQFKTKRLAAFKQRTERLIKSHEQSGRMIDGYVHILIAEVRRFTMAKKFLKDHHIEWAQVALKEDLKNSATDIAPFEVRNIWPNWVRSKVSNRHINTTFKDETIWQLPFRKFVRNHFRTMLALTPNWCDFNISYNHSSTFTLHGRWGITFNSGPATATAVLIPLSYYQAGIKEFARAGIITNAHDFSKRMDFAANFARTSSELANDHREIETIRNKYGVFGDVKKLAGLRFRLFTDAPDKPTLDSSAARLRPPMQ